MNELIFLFLFFSLTIAYQIMLCQVYYVNGTHIIPLTTANVSIFSLFISCFLPPHHSTAVSVYLIFHRRRSRAGSAPHTPLSRLFLSPFPLLSSPSIFESISLRGRRIRFDENDKSNRRWNKEKARGKKIMEKQTTSEGGK